MSDFVPNDARMPDPHEMYTWTPRLLMCINKSGYSLRHVRQVIKNLKRAYPFAPGYEHYHCKWCGEWHFHDKHDPQRLKKRRKLRRKEWQERWARRNQPK